LNFLPLPQGQRSFLPTSAIFYPYLEVPLQCGTFYLDLQFFPKGPGIAETDSILATLTSINENKKCGGDVADKARALFGGIEYWEWHAEVRFY